MSWVNGKLIICDRCGKSVFVKLISTSSYDGGFSSNSTFEKDPDGWKTYICIEEVVCLCPECHKEWKNVRDNFFRYVKNEER